MRPSLKWIGILGLFCILLLFSSGANGQSGTSTIRGEVSDPQGKAISGAEVTIKSPNTGFSRTQTTNSAGGFSFELIPPGEYIMEVQAAGFKKTVQNVNALVGSAISADVRLEIGQIDQVVQVESTGAVAVNTEDATLGNNFDNKQITQLPLESRDVLNLLTLQPGVTPTGFVSGARSDQSNITLDGVDINDQQIQSLVPGQAIINSLKTPVLRLNSEALEEFRVTTMNANSSQGRSCMVHLSTNQVATEKDRGYPRHTN